MLDVPANNNYISLGDRKLLASHESLGCTQGLPPHHTVESRGDLVHNDHPTISIFKKKEKNSK